MTHEEAKDEIYSYVHMEDIDSVHEFIDILYNDIESRICENCKHRQSNHANDMFWCINQDGANKYRTMDIRVDLDFGCNRFERKLESK